MYTLEQFYVGNFIPGTLCSKVFKYTGDLILTLQKLSTKSIQPSDGIADSINYVLSNFTLGPKTEGQNLLQLLTKSF